MEASLGKANNNGTPVHEVRQRHTADLAVQELAPRLDWSQMSESEHFVQFYETDAFLLNSLSGFIGTGLSAGEAGIVVATKAHREALEELLQEYGLDVAAARASGTYISLDAAETLSKFMVEGSPEPALFARVIGDIIARAAEGGQRVRIFGEMVALLWADGNYDAAIHLEELWNDLQEIYSFSLFCSYPINGFGGEALAKPLSDVCAGHSRVIPAESYTALINPDDRLRAITLLQQKARSLEAEIAERKEAEDALRAVKEELELQLEAREQLLIREHIARLASVINAAIDSAQLAADSRGIHLEVTLDPAASHISGDSSRLQQVFWNLLSNAIKFTPSGGRVEVRLERAGSNVQISVSDTGEGISSDFLPFIFDHFRQADGTSTRRHSGLGLGLAIVRHLVELHGGTVHADSPGEGCGATFTIRLPRRQDSICLYRSRSSRTS